MNKSKVKIGDVKKVKDQEHICKGFSTSGNPIWRKIDAEIEKGYQVGDEKDFNGRTYYVHELNAKGAPKWRLKKDGGSKQNDGSGNKPAAQQNSGNGNESQGGSQNQNATSQKKLEEMNPSELVDYAKNASTDALAKVVNDTKADKQLRQLAFNELKTRSDYDKTKVNSADLAGGHVGKPTAKVEYKTKKPEVEVNSDEFKDYEIQTSQGRKKVIISTFRNYLKGVTDDALLKLLNNTAPKADAIKRHLAYEEAAARGIPEDKIVTKGSLEKLWKKYKTDAELRDYKNKQNNEDEAIALNYDWKGLDHEKIMKEVFDGGEDPAWLDENSALVKKTFKLDTLSGRQKYDTFRDYYQRDPKLVPGYLTAQQKTDELNGLLWDWAQNETSPLFISAGGAGAGKTYGWREIVAPDLSLPELEPGDDPTNTDWGWVMLTDEDAEDEKVFAKTLEKYNGTFTGSDGNEYPHILFFDDADKLLTTQSKPLVAMMKKINDSDPKNRVFTNSKGEKERWRGKIIITTNKNMEKLEENPDTHAVLTRANKSNIYFTRNETLEILANRYENMSLKRASGALKRFHFTPEEEADFRQDVFDFLRDRVTESDPNKFSPRVFEDLIEKYASKWKNGSKARKTGAGNIGTDVPWQISAMSAIKAQSNDIEKSEYNEDMYSRQAMMDRKEKLEEIYARAKKEGKYDKLFGDKARDAVLFGGVEDEEEEKKEERKKVEKSAKKKSEKKEEETKKGFDNEMSLDEAESILFG